jgi:hypothetical protein
VRGEDLRRRVLETGRLEAYPTVTIATLRARADLEEVFYREDEDGTSVALFRVKAR